MKITRVEAIPIHVPIKAGMIMKTAHGEHVDSYLVIVKLHTDAGIVGIGEATVGPKWNGETSASCKNVMDDFLSPVLIGADPMRRTHLRFLMDDAIKQHPFAKSAIEMALYDIVGKALNVPVYQLLGGKVREKVPMKMVVGAFAVPQAVALAKQFLDWGVNTLKVKVGLDPQTDLERVKAIRELAGPSIPIGIDANGGWDLATARTMMDAMRPYKLLFIEQPIPPGDPIALREVRAMANGVPIMADESAFTLTDAWMVTHSHAADLISVYPGKNGGIDASREIVNLARAAGLFCHMGSNLELGIASAAMLHLAAATPGIACEKFPTDILGPLYHQFDIIKEPLKLGPIFAEVPQGPGLGVEIDEAVLAKCRG